MKNKKVFKIKNYTHIDSIPDFYDVIPKIKNASYIIKHGFYPFIGNKIIFKKYSKNIDERTKKHYKEKTRPIKYAAHIDSLIYQWYSHILNSKYDKFAKQNKFNDCVIAYRTCFPGMSSINFARRAIDFIKKAEECYILVSDFSNFFDKINHSVLKNNINKVLNRDLMPEDWYKVYRSMTKYCYLNKSDIENYLFENHYETKDTLKNKKCYFENVSWKQAKVDLKAKIKEGINKEEYGIPQGSSLSGIFANIYMIDFDIKLHNYVTSHDGMYMRYSDDIIIIIPIKKIKTINELWDKMIEYKEQLKNLEINKDKTCCYKYCHGEIKSLHSELQGFKKSPNYISYLGFAFDGQYVRLRDKTITKYYYKLYHKIDSMIFREKIRLKRGTHRKSKIDKHWVLKKLKSSGKNKRFSDYLLRAKKIFPEEIYIQEFDNKIKDKIFARFENIKKEKD